MEDEADILGQIILKKDAPNNFSAYFWNKLEEIDKEQCLQIIAHPALEPIPGFSIDPHRSACYRFWRSRKLDQELNRSKEVESLLIERIVELNQENLIPVPSS